MTAAADGLQGNCKPCNKDNLARLSAPHYAYIQEIKLESGCVDCGYRDDPRKLEFDHLPGFEKLFNVGRRWNASRAAVDAEIAKCEVVCAWCHLKRTESRGQAGWRKRKRVAA